MNIVTDDAVFLSIQKMQSKSPGYASKFEAVCSDAVGNSLSFHQCRYRSFPQNLLACNHANKWLVKRKKY